MLSFHCFLFFCPLALSKHETIFLFFLHYICSRSTNLVEPIPGICYVCALLALFCDANNEKEQEQAANTGPCVCAWWQIGQPMSIADEMEMKLQRYHYVTNSTSHKLVAQLYAACKTFVGCFTEFMNCWQLSLEPS